MKIKLNRICGTQQSYTMGKVYTYRCHYKNIKKYRDLSNNLMMHFKLLEKQEQTKSQIIKIRAEIKEIETKQIIQKNQ
jgi:hypothetical protein